MTTPENPFAGSEIPRVPHATATSGEPAPPAIIEPGVEDDVFPAWGMIDVLKIVIITAVCVTFTGVVALMIASAVPAFQNVPSRDLVTDARVIVPGQIAAYVIVLFFIYRIVAGYRGASFGDAIQWCWPHLRWPGFLLLGAILALGLLGLQNVLPMPKETPIQQLFRTASGAWVMTFFGVAIAPLVEEIFFRGVLFPVLAKKTNVTIAVLLTSLFFALIHASQLGKAWGPVLVLFLVGAALTLVRYWARSVAAAVLVHVGYNATLFSLLFAETDGFRHMEKLIT